MLPKSMFMDDGIIKMLIAFIPTFFVQITNNDVTSSIVLTTVFRGGWEARVVRIARHLEVVDGIGVPRGKLPVRMSYCGTLCVLSSAVCLFRSH